MNTQRVQPARGFSFQLKSFLAELGATLAHRHIQDRMSSRYSLTGIDALITHGAPFQHDVLSWHYRATRVPM